MSQVSHCPLLATQPVFRGEPADTAYMSQVSHGPLLATQPVFRGEPADTAYMSQVSHGPLLATQPVFRGEPTDTAYMSQVSHGPLLATQPVFRLDKYCIWLKKSTCSLYVHIVYFMDSNFLTLIELLISSLIVLCCTFIWPNKKIPVFRVTLPYLN